MLRSSRSILCLILETAIALGVSQALAYEEEVLLVGRSAAGELIVDSDFYQPVELKKFPQPV